MKAGIYRTQQGSLVYVRKDRSIGGFLYASGTFNTVNLEFKAVTSCKEQFIRFPELFDGLAERWADVPNGCTDPEKALRDAKAANDAAIKDALGLPADLKTGETLADWAQRTANPANVARAIAENCANALGIEVDHESFDKAAEELDKPAAEDDPYKRFASGGKVGERRYFTVPPELSAPYTEGELAAWRKKFADSLRKQGFRICHKVSARKHRKRGHTVIPLHDGWFAWRPTDYLFPYQREMLRNFGKQPNVLIKVPASLGKSEAGVL